MIQNAHISAFACDNIALMYIFIQTGETCMCLHTYMMMIDFITFKGSLVPLFEGREHVNERCHKFDSLAETHTPAILQDFQ
jgi:hypothetical protein